MQGKHIALAVATGVLLNGINVNAETTESSRKYRQTYYSVVQNNETNLGAGYKYGDHRIKAINNVMHFNDEYYGWIPVVAINLDEVRASGLNPKGTWNVYGSVVEMTYPNNNKTNAIILDACGACRYADKIDLWVYNNEQRLDVNGVTYKYIRKGWNEYYEQNTSESRQQTGTINESDADVRRNDEPSYGISEEQRNYCTRNTHFDVKSRGELRANCLNLENYRR